MLRTISSALRAEELQAGGGAAFRAVRQCSGLRTDHLVAAAGAVPVRLSERGRRGAVAAIVAQQTVDDGGRKATDDVDTDVTVVLSGMCCCARCV